MAGKTILSDEEGHSSQRHRRLGLEKINKYDEAGEQRERGQEDGFEPNMLDIDIPERMQISEVTTGPPPTDAISLDDESNWILNHLGTGMVPLFNTEGRELAIIKGDIVRFLEFMHVQKLDVPFIAMYRKEECQSLFIDPEPQDDRYNQKNHDPKPTVRWHKVLWAILDLDRKWLLLQKRKNALQLYYNKRFEEERSIHEEARLHLYQKLFDSITKSLKVAESEQEIDDVDSKFNLHFPPGDVGVDEGQFKRPKRKSQYNICCNSRLWEVASMFGYSSEEFGLLISLEQMRTNELEDAKETPEGMASRFTCAMFQNPQAVLRGARHMAVVEISREPYVRRHVRSIFMDNAVVSTNPTADGNVVIDSHHQFAGIKWLKDKPMTKFDDAQWLLIQKAEEEKLIHISVKLPVLIHDQLINSAYTYYLSDGLSKLAHLWNEQRKQIINDAFDGLLLPSMATEARTLLTSRAKNWLLMEYGRHFWDKVSVAPYHKKDHDVNSSDDHKTAIPRVMACCWGPGKPATTFVMLDSYGEVLDVLYAGSLSIRDKKSNNQQRKKNDQQRVVKFMTDYQPHAVVLGAVNLSCVRLRENIYEIFKMIEDNPRDVGHEMDGTTVVYADETIPRLYENSRISSEQLQSQSGIVKRAVALGRYLQNPFSMVATLCGPAKEILSWKLTPLESFLTPDEKYSMIEQIMVDVTNQVGIDVNLAISHEWLFAPLQFISGLGPRKATSLQRSLVRASSIYTRKDLLNHGIGKKVFVNAVGFLQVHRSGNTASSTQFFYLLHGTRVHPESYGLALELAKDMYIADGQDDVNDKDILKLAIEHVRKYPDLLKCLIVDAYARSKKFENKKDTLNLIRLELIEGFQDWRKQYAELSFDEEFYMITGETKETFSEGKIVQATVRWVQPQKAECVINSGLSGMLKKEDFSDDRRVYDLTKKLKKGDILTCKIKSIQKYRYWVFFSCKESELRNARSRNTESMDPYYHEDRDNLGDEKEKARRTKELAKKHFKSRIIVHPRFQYITANEATEMLSDKEPGESIIHPSSRGPSYLNLTLKIYDGVYAHKDIIEAGKTLEIGDDVFEDLDEVMDWYVDPLVAHLRTMLAYRNFRIGGKAEVDESLRKEKNQTPSRFVCAFGISHEYPGTFILTYLRSSNPHHEYVGLHPKGFKFRKKMFEEIDRLLEYFQRHVDDPQDEGPSTRSVAAMVPMRSSATCNSDGWKSQSGYHERTGRSVLMRSSANGGSGGWKSRSRYHERTGMGLLKRTKLSTRESVTETTEPVQEEQRSILEKAFDFVVMPCDTVSALSLKRKGIDTVPTSAAAGPSSRACRPEILCPETILGAPDSSSDASSGGDSSVDVPSLSEGAKKRKKIACSGSGNAPCHSFSPSVTSEGNEVNPLGVFVPDWKLTNGNILETPNLCREFMYSVRTPAEASQDASLSHNTAAVNAFIETHPRFMEGVKENHDLKNQIFELQEQQVKLEAENLSLQTFVTALQSKCLAAETEKDNYAHLLGETESQRRKEKTTMQEDLYAKSIKHLTGELKVSKDYAKTRISEFESLVARLWEERRWLVAEGMGKAFEKIRSSDEFLDLVADINSLANGVGFNAGLKAGVDLGKEGKKPEDDERFEKDALSKLHGISAEFDVATFPMMNAISAMYDSSLSDIQAFLAPADA